MHLLLSAVSKFAAGILLLGGLLFGCAGTFAYPNAWLFVLILFLPMFLLGCVLFVKSPALLEKRLRHREQDPAQLRIVALSGVLFIAVFALCGLDFRYQLTHVPAFLTVFASITQLCAYALYAQVMRENAFLSRTVEIQESQTVVSTGLYGIVRHPMYAATILLFLSMPLVLGSLAAFILMLLYPVFIVLRIRREEAFLHDHLQGYTAYTQQVRWRLFPFLW